MKFPTFKREQEKLREGFHFVAGCDEVGVAPLAGPVVAAACVIDPSQVGGYRSKSKWYYRVRDSKTVNEEEREALIQEIKAHCLCFGIGEVEPEKIDEINIHHASLLAMRKAVGEMLESLSARCVSDETLKQANDVFLFIDGRFPLRDLEMKHDFSVTQEAVIDGDALLLSISAASIIAKVYRDSLLKKIDEKFPEYGFAQHKGYNTRAHREALIRHGITPFHRHSFLRNIEFNF